MVEERRFQRKNEEVMMGKIDEIIAILGKQDTKIAVIETKAIATEEHLRNLNSKVAAHESRIQTEENVSRSLSESISLPIKIIYSTVGVIALGVIGALLKLVIKP